MMNSELLPSRESVEHDFTTIGSYPEYVAKECTCGYHAPPVGLACIPQSHIEHCEFRTNRLRDANNINQKLL